MTEQGILEPFQSLGAGAHVLQSERSGGLLLSPQRLFLLTLVRRTQLASTQCKLVGTALGTAWVCNLVFLLNLVTLPAQEGEPAHARGSAQKKRKRALWATYYQKVQQTRCSVWLWCIVLTGWVEAPIFNCVKFNCMSFIVSEESVELKLPS